MLRHIRDTSSSDCPSLDRIFHSSTDLPVVPICRRPSACAVGQITSLIRPPRAREEGHFAVVTNVGCGVRWTRHARLTRARVVDGEIVWS
jgi:hypothetical protein